MVKEKQIISCGLIGYPLKHSLSSVLHNAVYEKLKIEAVYLPVEVKSAKQAVKLIKTKNMKQVSVTMPLKQEIMPYLDKITPEAKKIGSVNTIVNKKGKLIGSNLDVYGLKKSLQVNRVNLKNKKVAVLGAGGAARTVCYLVKKSKGDLLILARNLKKAKELAKEFKGEAQKIADLKTQDYDILINTTPVGMFPEVNKMPVKTEDVKRGATVIDIVYNPAQTVLLKAAKKKGCKTVSGLDMFLYQAAAQVEAWQGKKVPIKFMKEILTKIAN